MTVKKSNKKPTKNDDLSFFCSLLLVVDFYLCRNNTLEIYAFIPAQVESVDCQKNDFTRQFPHLPDERTSIRRVF